MVKNFKIQFSLAIPGGYFPDKSRAANTKISIIRLNYAKFGRKLHFPLVFEVFASLNCQNCKYQDRE